MAGPDDIKAFMKNYGIKESQLTGLEFAPLFHIFDYNDDGYIDFEDFVLFILPQDDMKIRSRAEKLLDLADELVDQRAERGFTLKHAVLNI